MEDEENFQLLSLDEKLSNKSWRARLSAYDELAKKFRNSDPTDPIFKERLDDMRKVPLESNAACLDGALTALHSYIDASDNITKLRPLIISNLIEKCLGASRASTRSKALEVILELAGADNVEPILTELLNFVNHKQPKIVSVAIHAVTEILSNFGCSQANAKLIVKHVPQMFQHPDGNVRTEGNTLVGEIASWTGASIVSSCFDGLKPVQVKELKELISKVSDKHPTPKRFKRSEKMGNVLNESGIKNEQAGFEEHNMQELTKGPMDSYDAAEAVEVLDKIDESILVKAESTSWKERKEALEEILKIVNVPKIAAGQFSSLISMLTKRIGDVNVNVVSIAAQVVEALARGLRTNLSSSRKEICSALLDRSKEKNKATLESIQKALEAMVLCFSLNCGDWLEEYNGPFIAHKNPQVRVEYLRWLGHFFAKIKPLGTKADKKTIKVITEPILKLLDDPSLEVREITIRLCAVLNQKFGERELSSFLDGVDKTKLEKIRDISSKLPTESMEKPTLGNPAHRIALPEAHKPSEPKVSHDALSIVHSDQSRTKIKDDYEPSNGVKRAVSTKPAVSLNTQHSQEVSRESSPEMKEAFSSDPILDATEMLNDLIPELKSSLWKVRKEAMEKAAKILKQGGRGIKLSSDDFLIELKSRLTDTNRNLIVQSLDLFANLIEAMGESFQKFSKQIITPIINCLCDNKPQVRLSALKVMTAIVVSCGGMQSLLNSFSFALATESAALRRELLAFLAKQEYNKCCNDDLNNLASITLVCLQDKSAEVRKACSNLVLVLLNHVESAYFLQLCTGNLKNREVLPILKNLIESHKCVVTTHLPIPSQEPTQVVHTISLDPIPPNGRVFSKNSGLNSNAEQNHNEMVKKLPFPEDDLATIREAAKDYVAPWVEMRLFSNSTSDVITALSAIDQAIASGDEVDGLRANISFILRLVALYLENSEPSIFEAALSVLERVITVSDRSNWRLTELELRTIMVPFLRRVGTTKGPSKEHMQLLFRQLCRVYPASKLCGHLMDLLQEDSIIRFQALLEICHLLKRNGLIVIQASKHVPQLLATVDSCDDETKKVCFDILIQLSKLLGEEQLGKYMESCLSEEAIRQFKNYLTPNRNDMTKKTNDSNELITEKATTQYFSGDLQKSQLFLEKSHQRVFGLDPELTQFRIRAEELSLNVNEELPGGRKMMESISKGNLTSQSIDSIEALVKQISLGSDIACVAALQKLDEYLSESQIAIGPSAIPLVQSLAARLRDCVFFPLHGGKDCEMKSKISLHVLNILILLTVENPVMLYLDHSSGSLLIKIAIECILSPNLSILGGEDQLKRVLNVLLIKLLNNIPLNISFPALLNLLDEGCTRQGESSEDRYVELIMKSLWKLTKQLPQAIEKNGIDLQILLREMDVFLSHHPPLIWKSKLSSGVPNGDLPYRTVKTIIHEIVIALRERLIPIVRRLPNFQRGFVFLYVKTMLQSNNVDVSSLENYEASSTNRRELVSQLSNPIEDPAIIEEQLKVICNKICSTPDTRSGLLELAKLLEQYPQYKEHVDAYLSSLGAFFYKYIKRNLAQLQGRDEFITEELLDAHRKRLLNLQTTLSNGERVVSGTESGSMVGHLCNNHYVKNRLESPAVRTPLKQANNPIFTNDTTIKSLKERLALLRHGISREETQQ